MLYTILLVLLVTTVTGYAIGVPVLQDNKTKQSVKTIDANKDNKEKNSLPQLDQVVIEEDTIPDSLLHARWKMTIWIEMLPILIFPIILNKK